MEASQKRASETRTWPGASFDLVSLRHILAAAEEQSFAAAAQKEHTSLSAVSRRVAELEQRVGITLFDRHDRGVSLTEAGTRFVQQLYEVFDRLENIALDLEKLRGGTRGIVRVSTPMTGISGDLPSRLAEFLSQNPDVEVEIVEETSIAAMHGVSVGDLDLALVPGTSQFPNLSFIPWIEEELVVILPNGHALADSVSVKLVDLADHPFIGMQRESGLFSLYRQQMNSIGRKLKERAHTTSFESVRQMVSAGMGIAILPADAAYPYAEQLQLVVRELEESWSKRPLVLCMRKPDRRSAATKMLIAHLLS